MVSVELERYLKVAGEAAEEMLLEEQQQQQNLLHGEGGGGAEQLGEEEHTLLARLMMNLHQVQDQEHSNLNELNSPRRQAAITLSNQNLQFRYPPVHISFLGT